jgi:hypothetical protein
MLESSSAQLAIGHAPIIDVFLHQTCERSSISPETSCDGMARAGISIKPQGSPDARLNAIIHHSMLRKELDAVYLCGCTLAKTPAERDLDARP